LHSFIEKMRPSDRLDPVRIMIDDSAIHVAKEICRAEDVYMRPKEERKTSCGYPKCYIDGPTKDWERTLDKGDIFIWSY